MASPDSFRFCIRYEGYCAQRDVVRVGAEINAASLMANFYTLEAIRDRLPGKHRSGFDPATQRALEQAF